jgi:hypothetical protein
MERYLLKVPTRPCSALFFQDLWTCIASACEWPELYSLTQTCSKARKAAKRELEYGCFKQFLVPTCEVLLQTCRVCEYNLRWIIEYKTIPVIIIINKSPYQDCMSALYVIYRLCKMQTLREIELLFEWKVFSTLKPYRESFQRFARISGAIKMKGPLKKWNKIKRV